jgi:hypothetical protein
VDTGGFLIRYSNGHMHEAFRQLKKFLNYFQKYIIRLTKKVNFEVAMTDMRPRIAWKAEYT